MDAEGERRGGEGEMLGGWQGGRGRGAAGAGARERARREQGGRGMEEDYIDPLVAPPLLSQRRHHYVIHHPSVYPTCARGGDLRPTLNLRIFLVLSLPREPISFSLAFSFFFFYSLFTRLLYSVQFFRFCDFLRRYFIWHPM